MSEITFNLDAHPEYGFYQINGNGMKCEFMELEGYRMRCNKDFKEFVSGQVYLIESNCNDFICYLNEEKLKNIPFEVGTFEYECEKQNCFSLISVKKFQDGTFTLM